MPEEISQPTLESMTTLKEESDTAWTEYAALREAFPALPTQPEIDALCAAYHSQIAKVEAWLAALKNGRDGLGCNTA